MIDEHLLPTGIEHWGIRPILFTIGNVSIPSYESFVLLAIILGLTFFFWQTKRQKANREHALFVAAGAILGGAIGAKLPIWIMYFSVIDWTNPIAILSGRTIIGGLIGGALGVFVIKKMLQIKTRHGNMLAPAIALGMAIGRIGCILRGCCYGTPTTMPWAVDLGDGILRHPTQIYEALFCLIAFLILWAAQKRFTQPIDAGKLLTHFFGAYFVFRFFIEFIRENHIYWFGLTAFQYLCIIGVIFVYRREIMSIFSHRKSSGSRV